MENMQPTMGVATGTDQKHTRTDPFSALCATYGYPTKVAKHLLGIVNTLEPDRADSIILLGSTSRGELSWKQKGETFELLSDYEFFVVGNYPKELQRVILDKVECWETALPEGGPLFHIDVSFMTVEQLRQLPPYWRHFEARETGYVLFGLDLRSLIPKIDLNNLDFHELNQILLWRNFHLVMQLPSPLLMSQNFDDSSYAYFLSRNALDLTTWALPHEGYMIPGFANRVAFIKENYKRLPIVQKCGPAFANNLERWLEIKLGQSSPKDAVSELAEVIEVLNQARISLNTIYKRRANARGYPRRAFGDYRTRSIAKRFAIAARNTKSVSAGWIASPSMALFAEGLLEMLKAARNIVLAADPKQHLSRASAIVQRLLPKATIKNEKDNVELWFELRRAYLEFGLFYFPFLAQKENYWRGTIE